MAGKSRTKHEKCDLYLPGHLVHWIQARRASEVTPRIGTLVGVADGIITVEYLDKIGRYRNHRAHELAKIAEPGTKVRVFERFSLLSVDLDNRTTKMFCIADADKLWVPCSYQPLTSVTPEALAERLNTRGGFSVPGRLLKDWQEGQSAGDLPDA